MKKRSKSKKKKAVRKNIKAVNEQQDVENVADIDQASGYKNISSPSDSNIQELDTDIDSAQILSHAKKYWLFADWNKLVLLDNETISNNPDRAIITILMASAYQQLDKHNKAKQYARTALKWGCSPKLVAKILIAGVHITLGRIAAIKNDENRIEHHFKESVAIIESRDTDLFSHTRAVREITRMGLLSQAAGLVEEESKTLPSYGVSPKENESRAKILSAEIVQLNRALLMAKKEAQLDYYKYADKESLVSRTAIDLSNVIMEGNDFLQEASSVLTSDEIANEDKFGVCVELSLNLKAENKILSQHFANTALDYLSDKKSLKVGQEFYIANVLQNFDQQELSLELLLDSFEDSGLLTDKASSGIRSILSEALENAKKKRKHGHDLLISYIENSYKPDDFENKPPVFIEVGTTRENVFGHGSTQEIAKLCLKMGINFLTVDMDQHNSEMANAHFSKHGLNFQAITDKGEDFLKQWQGTFDFVFLDAYDFDHGNHSELRQSRYVKFLGSRIDEKKCHQMHLDCAVEVEKKLSSKGVVCIDDTWLDSEDKWTAKGATAVPYLLNKGFEIIEARNRSVLMRRSS